MAANTRAPLIAGLLLGIFLPPGAWVALALVEPLTGFVVYCLLTLACAIGCAFLLSQRPGGRAALSIALFVGFVVTQAAIVFVGCCALVALNR